MLSMQNARVLVTGWTGFLGGHLARLLEKEYGGTAYVFGHDADPSRGVDLTDPGHAEGLLENVLRGGPLDAVFHLAGFNGGIEFNRRYPADIFYTNTVMGLNLLEACAGRPVGKVVSVVASCGYPDPDGFADRGDTAGPRRGVLSEGDFLGHHHPHPSVACHGLAKRNLQLASSFYRRQYDLHAVCVCPTTLYGPGDTFDPVRTKLMGAMVRRFVDAQRTGDRLVTVWGTGAPLREFLYAEDCAELLVRSATRYDDSTQPLNLGSGQEISVADLAEAVAVAVGYDGGILFDHTKPDGQFRKRLDLTRMRKVLGDFTPTPLPRGIADTVAWYKEYHP